MFHALRHHIHRHTISFRHAFDGVKWAVSTQPNFRVHLFLSACALTLSAYLGIEPVEWVIIIFTIVLGLSSEMVNTAIESVTDLVTTEYRLEAKVAKDVAAGMMLITACGAIVVAITIFLPYIVDRLL
jgi:diacylglycerol kinase (ATP)